MRATVTNGVYRFEPQTDREDRLLRELAAAQTERALSTPDVHRANRLSPAVRSPLERSLSTTIWTAGRR